MKISRCEHWRKWYHINSWRTLSISKVISRKSISSWLQAQYIRFVEYDSFLWLIELSINEQGSIMQIRGQAIEGGGYPNLIASQTGCFITHQLLDFKRSLPLKAKQFSYLYFVLKTFRPRYAMTPGSFKVKTLSQNHQAKKRPTKKVRNYSEFFENVRLLVNKIIRWSNGSLSMGFTVLSNFCIDLLIQKQYLRFVKNCQNKESNV